MSQIRIYNVNSVYLHYVQYEKNNQSIFHLVDLISNDDKRTTQIMQMRKDHDCKNHTWMSQLLFGV